MCGIARLTAHVFMTGAEKLARRMRMHYRAAVARLGDELDRYDLVGDGETSRMSRTMNALVGSNLEGRRRSRSVSPWSYRSFI